MGSLKRKFHDRVDNGSGTIWASREAKRVKAGSRDHERGARLMWHNYIRRLHLKTPDFFSSDNAKLAPNSETCRGQVPYEGVKVSNENCLSLRVLDFIYYRAKQRFREYENDEEYQRLSFTVSQILRLGAAHSVCSELDLYKAESLFLCVANMSLLEHFIDFCFECQSPRTLKRKATHLRRICDVGHEFMRNEQERSSLRRASEYVKGITSAYRVITRQGPPCGPSERLPLCILRNCMKGAHESLLETMAWYEELNRRQDPVSTLPQFHLWNLVKRWTPAFVTLLVIHSGGQAPKTLTRITARTERGFERDLKKASVMGFVSLPTLKGKRTASLGMPTVTLPNMCLPFLRFHVSVVNPALEVLTKGISQQMRNRYMLLSERDGSPMASWKVSYEFKKGMAQLDPRSAGFSIRAIRITCMRAYLVAYRTGMLLNGYTENQIVDIIARHFNTSGLQVRRNVGYRGSAEHVATAKELTGFFRRVM